MVNRDVTLASVGGQVDVPHGKSNFEIFMRYQVPVQSASGFKVDPGVIFDGSLGYSRLMKSRWQWGVFWFGHMLKAPVAFSGKTGAASGEQNVFFSSVDGRIGYFFE